MHFFITGHTGFKGTWLSLLLIRQGHKVSGFSLPPEEKSLFNLYGVSNFLHSSFIGDIRDRLALKKALEESKPDVLIHLAAQPLVREGYRFPKETFDVNVVGTMNLVELSRDIHSLKATLIVTTDKVYKEEKVNLPYNEDAPLGGSDPYSASKAMADIFSQSWAKSFGGSPILIGRAGNVIGGGDYSKERLIPDLIASFENDKTALIRNPMAIRPWQHVLDCLWGYQTLIQKTISGEIVTGSAWNFGPDETAMNTVSEVADLCASRWSSNVKWLTSDNDKELPEAEVLTLDSSKSSKLLGWKNHIDFPDSIYWTVDWYKYVSNEDECQKITNSQIDDFLLLLEAE
jgi:CDP-glucose 4,6-dehydratase